MNHWALRVARSTSLSATAEILARAANTVFFIILTWFVSEAAAGRYSLGFIFSTLLLPLAFAGVEQLLNREAARDPTQAPRLLGNLLLARAVGSLLCYLLLLTWLVLDRGYDPQAAIVIAIIAATIVPESLINLYQSYLFAFERVIYITLVGALTGGLKLVLGVVVLALGGGATGAASVVLATSMLTFLAYAAIIARRIGPPRWHPDWRIWRQSLRPAGSFFVIALLLTLEHVLGPLLLSRLHGMVAVGVYSAAANLINLLRILPTSFRQAILPLMAQAATTSRHEALRMMAQSLRLLLTATLFLTINLSLLAPPLLTLLYKGRFVEATPVFITLVWAFLFTTCAIPHGRMIVVVNHQGRFIPFHLMSLVLNLALVLVLLPLLGVYGVALATLASSCFIFVAGVVYVQRHVKRWPVGLLLRGPLTAGALMLVGVWALQLAHLPLALALPGGWLIYGAALWGLRVFSLEDVRLLQRLIRRRAAALNSP